MIWVAGLVGARLHHGTIPIGPRSRPDETAIVLSLLALLCKLQGGILSKTGGEVAWMGGLHHWALIGARLQRRAAVPKLALPSFAIRRHPKQNRR